MLIKIDILISKDINLIILTRFNYINIYRIKFKLNVTLSRSFIKRDIVLKRYITILAKAYLAILIEYSELSISDYIFKLVNEYSIALFIILVNLSFHAVLARNDLN